MTGQGQLSIRPIQRLRWVLGIQLFWIGFIAVLAVWWGSVILDRSEKIVALKKELATARGQTLTEEPRELQSAQRMIYAESSAFIFLMVSSTFLVFWFYRREKLRAKSMQAFFASVTHELRTPLTSIRLQAESIHDAVAEKGDTALHPLVDRLMDDTTRLQTQVDRTLELARLEGGGILNVNGVSIADWILRARAEFEGRKDHSVEFQVKLEPAIVLADTGALRTIFRNLVENSVRYSGTNPTVVTVEGKPDGNLYRLSVSDRGKGIQGTQGASGGLERRLGQIFQRGEKSQGAGVGLYLVRALSEKMGGRASFGGHPSGGFQTQIWLRREEPSHGN
ncbi:MAG: HAMP domain-containing histidine kinase [Bdellovibrionales bacterium]|nr:HAMP domain-containing histidine kinase [Bdellovibrionales bacterium]